MTVYTFIAICENECTVPSNQFILIKEKDTGSAGADCYL